MRVIIKRETWVFTRDQLQPIAEVKMSFWKKQPLKRPPLNFPPVLSLPSLSQFPFNLSGMSSVHKNKKATLVRGKGLEARILLVAFFFKLYQAKFQTCAKQTEKVQWTHMTHHRTPILPTHGQFCLMHTPTQLTAPQQLPDSNPRHDSTF